METDAGIPLTEKEVKLVESLERLAKKWKKDGKRLWLFSGSGSLHVMMYEGENNPNPTMLKGAFQGGVNPDNVITTISIPNDGGDW